MLIQGWRLLIQVQKLWGFERDRWGDAHPLHTSGSGGRVQAAVFSPFGTRNPQHYGHYGMTFCPITMLLSPS